jgi:hypothetical protein
MNREYLSRNTAGHLRFPFIWKLQNHAFVRSISKGPLAVGEFADAAHSTEDGLLRRDDPRDSLSRPRSGHECKTINIGRAGTTDDGFTFLDVLENPRTLSASMN